MAGANSIHSTSPVGYTRPLPYPMAPEARPTPLPKRPKGRWFVGAVLTSFCGLFAYGVWDSFYRYEAYGTVTGQVVQVAVPRDGQLQYLQVREGDRVRQEEALFTLDNIELKQRYARLGDEIRVALAAAQAESANLKWQAAFGIDQSRGAVATYYETLGTLLREQAQLNYLQLELNRSKALRATGSGTQEELDQNYYNYKGQEELVGKLKEALADLKPRADQVDSLLRKDDSLSAGLEQSGLDQLKPSLAKVEALEAERTRVQEQLDQLVVRAPANGTVLKVLQSPGEYCKAGDPVMSLLAEDSLEVVLYMPQNASVVPLPGSEINLVLDPYPDPLACKVVRLGNQFEPAPEHLKRHYREGQRLLPVFLKPNSESAQWMALRVGGVVKLPSLRLNLGASL